jgi:hypothetical protein
VKAFLMLVFSVFAFSCFAQDNDTLSADSFRKIYSNVDYRNGELVICLEDICYIVNKAEVKKIVKDEKGDFVFINKNENVLFKISSKVMTKRIHLEFGLPNGKDFDDEFEKLMNNGKVRRI